MTSTRCPFLPCVCCFFLRKWHIACKAYSSALNVHKNSLIPNLLSRDWMTQYQCVACDDKRSIVKTRRMMRRVFGSRTSQDKFCFHLLHAVSVGQYLGHSLSILVQICSIWTTNWKFVQSSICRKHMAKHHSAINITSSSCDHSLNQRTEVLYNWAAS